MPYDSYAHFRIEVAGGVATVTIDRAEQRNAISPDAHRELERLWIEIAENDAVRAIVLTGAGDKAFSAGGDLRKMRERAGTEEGLKYNLALHRHINALLERMLAVPQPIVAAVNGDAIGLGLTLALFSDLSVVAEDARLADTHVKAGLVAGDGGTVIFPLLVGMARARHYLLRGSMFDGREAVQVGLMTYARPRGEVLAEAQAIAAELAALPRYAVQFTKLSANKPIRQQMNLVSDAAAALETMTALSCDHQEALDAMLEKRPARFKHY